MTDECQAFSTIGIHYRDAFGRVTQRVISVLFIDEKFDALRGGAYEQIVAFCHLRNDVRSFNLDQIIGAFAVDTGEPISNLTLVPVPSAEKLSRFRNRAASP